MRNAKNNKVELLPEWFLPIAVFVLNTLYFNNNHE